MIIIIMFLEIIEFGRIVLDLRIEVLFIGIYFNINYSIILENKVLLMNENYNIS